jgi:effector-binding domain-containing protein
MPKWKCPKCGRTFAVKTKEHSCVRISAESHFEGKPTSLKKVYDKLENAVTNFGDVSIQPIKGGIFFKKAGTFAMIAIRKDHLKVEFFLDHLHDSFPVEKTFQYTQKKIVHVVSVSSVKEVDKQLINWLKISYSLAK